MSAVVVGVSSVWAEKPAFCNGLDCPEFEVETARDPDGDNIEVRQYAPSAWVSTTIQNVDYSKAGSAAFMKLFAYISGENETKQKIDMTAPVISKITPGQGPACESFFTVSFYVPSLQSSPKPTDPTVFLEQKPAMRVAVSQFGGRMSDYETKVFPRLEALITAIDNKELKIKGGDEPEVYTAGYDSPFRLFNRHNEVWIVLEEATESSSELRS
uniref:Heme-binding protein 2 n=1 Tax=Chromera velia CCMP2878 TaxID=1169474 RepID=A0A0G4GSW3_9ALVE|eukprot:Cvel_23252.t1-p1 / transcript=Cvel_23252.t1 / gene=Cvel_23252 / organism=Chromera_velia_CCMP2878 / gene_product=Heme-binding protein 2, putative / transcript_product=Heme-binding protein 2, putative / location=Cvel_scaffold2376:14209-15245(+) / protein_length=213 / sequence_SO=supercontig / SO=protein_coding / is_pseudo=false